MVVTLFGILIDDSNMHTRKASSQTNVTLSEITIDSRDLHAQKARSFVVATSSGSLIYPLKVCLPMVVTLFGILIDARDAHPEKAPTPISVTEESIITLSTCMLETISPLL